MNIDQIQSILGAEIECGVFESVVVPALDVCRKVAASSAATVSDEASVALTDEQIIDIWCNTPTTRFGGEVEDQEIIDFARVLLDASPAASSAATVSDAASVQEPVAIDGLGRMTDEDNGFVTLHFLDESAAQNFMTGYAPTVEDDDMPPLLLDEASAIHQVSFSDDDGWLDTNKSVYDSHPEHARRIVYTTHQAATTAGTQDERAALMGLSRHQCNAIEYFVTQMRGVSSAVYIDMFDAFRDYINSLVCDARAASSATAPLTSDSDAAVGRVQALFQPWPEGEIGPTDEPESQYRLGYNTAIEDALEILARAQSTNGEQS